MDDLGENPLFSETSIYMFWDLISLEMFQFMQANYSGM